MTKIKSIKVENYKALENEQVELNGSSIIMIAGNNKGKSSLLKGLIDRFQGNKPSVCLLYTSPSPRDQRGSRMPSSA